MPVYKIQLQRTVTKEQFYHERGWVWIQAENPDLAYDYLEHSLDNGDISEIENVDWEEEDLINTDITDIGRVAIYSAPPNPVSGFNPHLVVPPDWSLEQEDDESEEEDYEDEEEEEEEDYDDEECECEDDECEEELAPSPERSKNLRPWNGLLVDPDLFDL